MRPPPSRIAETSATPEPFLTGSPVVDTADFSCCTVHVGWRCLRTATAPAMCGDAMLVPLSTSHWLFGKEERTLTPGAVTSGLNWSEIVVGALSEKPAITSAAVPPPPSVDAATVIAPGAFAGEPIPPLPASPNELPAATTGTTPASAAASIALTTMSRLGSISGSPSERLITSMPSFTACSIPAAISGELPSRPKSVVGTVSTL